MAISHVGHNHPATAAGRRACRAGSAPAPVATTDYISQHINKVLSAHKVKAKMDRAGDEMVSSTCVQAALHINAHGGKCACGWVAAS